ncbi:MAG: DUF1007 family protein [Thioalkalivibrio sp.]|nr:MAG: DUF1007 family protein [Thioalkalivibrio sp.]
MKRGLPILALLLFGGTLSAHPHAWIDLRVSVLFNADGDVKALRQEWAFDPTYSHLLLEDLAVDQPDLDLDAALELMTGRMLGNLSEYGYFTEIEVGERRLEPGPARNGSLDLRQRRLHLQFELPLEAARPEATRPLNYRVYDPTYWIEILHDQDDVIHLADGGGCSTRIQPARPEPWLVAYAATLERDQRAPIEDLGRRFAEVVSIECKPR